MVIFGCRDGGPSLPCLRMFLIVVIMGYSLPFHRVGYLPSLGGLCAEFVFWAFGESLARHSPGPTTIVSFDIVNLAGGIVAATKPSSLC